MINELKESLQEKRLSNNNNFINKMREILRRTARGDVAGVADALENDPSLINRTGQQPFWGGEVSALHVAAEWGQKKLVDILLKKGADPDGAKADYDGWSPLHTAICQRSAP